MFNIAPDNALIPTLTFTKAELAYVLAFLTGELSPLDNYSRIEMVEIRHYLNQIKDTVARAAADGTLGRAVSLSEGEGHKDIPPPPKAAPMPSMSELRAQFPTLSDDEIREVLSKAQNDRRREDETRRGKETPPPPAPSFIAKPNAYEILKPPPKPLSKREEKDRENSVKFAEMLGSI